MLSQFTWNQFLFITGATMVFYYLAVLFLFYREEAKRLLLSLKNRTNLQADQPIPPQVSIMGAASDEAAPLLTEAAAIQVAASQEVEPDPEAAVLQNILKEVKPLLEVTMEAKPEKGDFLSLLSLIVVKHAPHYREAVSRLLLEESQDKLPFELTSADIRSLWPGDVSTTDFEAFSN